VLIIPAGFGAALTGADMARPPALRVVTDADKRIAGDVTRSLAEGIGAQLDAVRLGAATTLTTGEAPSPERIQEVVTAAQAIQIPLEVVQTDTGDAYRPAAYFGASMGILFLFFTVGAGARSLLLEREEGTLARVRAAPITDQAVVVGKAVSVFIVGVVSLFVIWGATTLLFGARWGDPAAVAVVLVATVVAIAGISTVIAAFARTNAQANALTTVAAFVLALLGGSFQQAGTLPGIFATIALFTPNGLALRALTRIGAADVGLADTWPTVVVLFTMGALTALIGLARLRTKVLA
jgi:ABC-2 type transport system permease protein